MALTRPKYSQIYDSDFKNSCRLATSTNITLAGGAPSSLDGKSLVAGNRILVRAQNTASQNGIYYVSVVGTGSNGTWLRTLDALDGTRLTSGTTLSVEEGTSFGGKLYRMTAPDPITIDVSDIVWTDVSGGGAAAGDNGQIQYNWNNAFTQAVYLNYSHSDGSITANSGINSTSITSGAVKIQGGTGISGNLVVGSTVYAGPYFANFGSNTVAGFSNATAVFSGNVNSWSQLVLQNRQVSGAGISTDLIAYANNGNNDTGWIDIGITGNNYVSQGGQYTITGSNDGYLFMSAPSGANNGGNLFISTDSTGTFNDIVFSTGGFNTGQEQARFKANIGLKLIQGTPSTSTTTGALTVAGGIGVVGNVNIGGDLNVIGNITQTGNNFVINTSSLSTSDNALLLHYPTGGGNLTVDDGQDIGLVFNYYKGSNKYGALLLTSDESELEFYITGSYTGNTFVGTSYGTISGGGLNASNTTPSTSTTTGALKVSGGAGIAGNVYVGGNEVVTGNSTVGNISTTIGTFATSISRNSRNVVTNYSGNTAPATPLMGDEWFRGNTGVMYKYLYDNVSSTYNWINISSALYNANTAAVASTLALRDTGGNLTATNFLGVASSAKYADLAEIYASDKEYLPGTVVVFGGKAEVTTTTKTHDTRVAGVVSTNPAYLMNSEATGLPVAFTGRVPCLVCGPVTKGDVLVTSAHERYAERLDDKLYRPGCVLGKALGEVADKEFATIEVVVGRF